MTRPAGLFMLAFGLILALAIHDRVEGIDLEVTGVILAVIGGVALLYSVIEDRD